MRSNSLLVVKIGRYIWGKKYDFITQVLLEEAHQSGYNQSKAESMVTRMCLFAGAVFQKVIQVSLAVQGPYYLHA